MVLELREFGGVWFAFTGGEIRDANLEYMDERAFIENQEVDEAFKFV